MQDSATARRSGPDDPAGGRGRASRWTGRRRGLAVVVGLVVGVLVAGTVTVATADRRGGPNGPPQVGGVVEVAGEVASGWTVELFAAGTGAPERMASDVTGRDGSFRVRNRPGVADADIRYLVATGGSTEKMLLVLGPTTEVPPRVVVNELTTVASIWPLAQFLDGDRIQGNSVGLVAGARNVPNLVDLATGRLSDVVLDTANLQGNTAATMGTLAGLYAGCLVDTCAELFTLATPPGGSAPADTLEAFHDIARNPWHNVLEIFHLQPSNEEWIPPYLPALLFPPTAFTMSLNYTEGGFNAPGGLKIDSHGDVWTNNNFVVGSQSVLLAVGAPYVPDPDGFAGIGATKLRSDGSPVSPRTGFLGGGTFGGAFGMAVDADDHAWIGNFGGDSLTELAPDGTPISPDSDPRLSDTGGYHDDGFDSPQDTIVTADGSIWTANLAGDTVSQLVGGDPNEIRTWGDGCPDGASFSSPWGLASDAGGQVFVTNTLGRYVSRIDSSTAPGDLCPVAQYPLDAGAAPQGIATDSAGNLWVAGTYGPPGTMTFLDASDGYAPTTFTGDDTTVGVWSVAVDGADNVWGADFFGKRIINLCGAAGNCPEGMDELGSRISPAGIPGTGVLGNGGGYGANGVLQSITAINVDQAGNVWAANNFNDVRECLLGEGFPDTSESGSTVEQERIQTTCGGNGAVVMLGVAAPVAAPMIGPPRQP